MSRITCCATRAGMLLGGNLRSKGQPQAVACTCSAWVLSSSNLTGLAELVSRTGIRHPQEHTRVEHLQAVVLRQAKRTTAGKLVTPLINKLRSICMRGMLPHLSFGIGSDRYREPKACTTGQCVKSPSATWCVRRLAEAAQTELCKAHRHDELVRVVASLLDLGSQARSLDAVLICGPPNVIMAGHGARPECDFAQSCLRT